MHTRCLTGPAYSKDDRTESVRRDAVTHERVTRKTTAGSIRPRSASVGSSDIRIERNGTGPLSPSRRRRYEYEDNEAKDASR